MTRGRSPVWTAVLVLLSVIIMLLGAFWVIRAVQHSSSSTVAMVGNESISEQEWVNELKRRYGKEILTQMLNHQAVKLEVQVRHIAVTEEEIQDDLAERISGYSSPADFYQEMNTQFGLSADDLRQESEYQIELEKIATADIKITDAEVDAYLKQYEQSMQKHQFDLAWIELDTEASAQQAIERIDQGEVFSSVAQSMSVDTFSAPQGGALGWIDQDDPFQPPELLKAIQDMQAGDVVGPIALSTGHYAIVQVTDIRPAPSAKQSMSRETARRKIALGQAKPLNEIEQQLREKYNAYILSVAE